MRPDAARGLGLWAAWLAGSAWLALGRSAAVGVARRRLARLSPVPPLPPGSGRPSGHAPDRGRDWGRPRSAAQDLPLFAELLAAALGAGCGVGDALAAVCRAVPGELSARVRDVCAALALGAPPRTAWAPLTSDPALRPLAVAMVRCATTGSPAAEALGHLAADLRARRRAAAVQAARSAGVRAVAPLGLCFLPAFVLVGVVPTAVGLAGSALGTG